MKVYHISDTLKQTERIKSPVITSDGQEGELLWPATMIRKDRFWIWWVDKTPATSTPESGLKCEVDLEPELVWGPFAFPVKASGFIILGGQSFKLVGTFPMATALPVGKDPAGFEIWEVQPVTATLDIL